MSKELTFAEQKERSRRWAEEQKNNSTNLVQSETEPLPSKFTPSKRLSSARKVDKANKSAVKSNKKKKLDETENNYSHVVSTLRKSTLEEVSLDPQTTLHNAHKLAKTPGQISPEFNTKVSSSRRTRNSLVRSSLGYDDNKYIGHTASAGQVTVPDIFNADLDATILRNGKSIHTSSRHSILSTEDKRPPKTHSPVASSSDNMIDIVPPSNITERTYHGTHISADISSTSGPFRVVPEHSISHIDDTNAPFAVSQESRIDTSHSSFPAEQQQQQQEEPKFERVRVYWFSKLVYSIPRSYVSSGLFISLLALVVALILHTFYPISSWNHLNITTLYNGPAIVQYFKNLREILLSTWTTSSNAVTAMVLRAQERLIFAARRIAAVGVTFLISYTILSAIQLYLKIKSR